MRILLFTGKGGVGKTTAAAATATRLAAIGHKTLIMSADPAHSLAVAFGTDLDSGVREGGASRDGGPLAGSDEPTEVAPGLMAYQVDSLARMQRHWSAGGDWSTITDQLRQALSAGGLDPILAEELVVIPGLDELSALLALDEQVASGLYDVIVVDCAPTGQTIRLLALPEVLDRYLERIFPVHQRMLSTLGLLSRAGPSGTGSGRGAGRDALVRAIGQLHTRLLSLRQLLTDPAITRVRLVLTPELSAISEARRCATALSLFGYTVDGIVLNRVLDDAGHGSAAELPTDWAWLGGWLMAQRAAIADVVANFPDLPIRRVGQLAAEPTGSDGLALVADQLYGDKSNCDGSNGADALNGPVVAPLVEVLPDGGDYLLRVALPHVDGTAVALNRVGDELAVDVAGQRRLITLPGLLARCRTIGASVADGVLTVRFEPDPDRWPRELFEASLSEARLSAAAAGRNPNVLAPDVVAPDVT